MVKYYNLPLILDYKAYLNSMKRIVVVLSLVFYLAEASGQVRYGPKLAFQTFAPGYSDAFLSDSFKVVPKLGFNAGFTLDYTMNDQFAFQTEVVYSRKGKKITGGISNMFEHNAVYHYLEMPVMLRMNINRRNERGPYQLYVAAGGFLSYWLAGRGTIKSFELDELAIPDITYKISYDTLGMSTTFTKNKIYLQEPNRIQVGLVVEFGWGIKVRHREHLMLGLRYNYRHTWLAHDSSIDVGLGEYKEDFRTLEHILSFNASYLFEWKIGEGKKGKSSVKKRPKS